MHISLDNITFYSQPPPAKPPPRSFHVPCFKPYEISLAPRALSHPSRPPSPATKIILPPDARSNVPPGFRVPAKEYPNPDTVLNEFDVEIEKIAMVQAGQATDEADLDVHRDLGILNGTVTDVQGQCTFVPSDNSDEWPLIETVSDSNAAFIPTESGSHHSVPPISPADRLGLYQDSIPSLGTCDEAYKDPALLEVIGPCARVSLSRSPDLLRHPHADPGAGIIMQDPSVVDDIMTSSERCGDRLGGQGDRMFIPRSVHITGRSVEEAGPDNDERSGHCSPPVAPTNISGLHQCSAPFLGACDDSEQDPTLPEISFPCMRVSPSPSPDILGSVQPLQVSPASGVIMRDESVVDDSQAESETSGDPVEGHGERMSTIQSVQINGPSAREASPDKDESARLTAESQAPASPRFTPQNCPVKRSNVSLICTRSFHPRPNAELTRSEQLPAVSVVIPTRRSDELVASTKTNHPRARRYGQLSDSDSDSSNLNKNRPAQALTGEYTPFSGGSSPRGRGHQRKKQRRAMENISTSINDQSPNPSMGDLDVTLGKTQEIFGRGILRIQTHGPRHVYFMSFLPEEPHRPSMPFTYEEQAEHSRSQDSGGSAYCENQIGNRHPERPSQKGSRAGKTTERAQALSKDDQLLIELKEEQCLPWKRIAEHFPGRSAGSLQVRYCTRLKGRNAGDSGKSGRRPNMTSGSSYRGTSCEAVQAAGARRKNTEGVARQRYGPPRRRQIVDRYSPV